MVKNQLSKELIEKGKALVGKLDDSGVKVDAALWLYFAELEGWKLVLLMPDLIRKGPKRAYRTVQAALSQMDLNGTISLVDISVAKPNTAVLSQLRKAIRTAKDMSGIRFTNNVVQGVLIEDAYIYRLH